MHGVPWGAAASGSSHDRAHDIVKDASARADDARQEYRMTDSDMRRLSRSLELFDGLPGTPYYTRSACHDTRAHD